MTAIKQYFDDLRSDGNGANIALGDPNDYYAFMRIGALMVLIIFKIMAVAILI